jgi:hypothetical protein
MNITNATVLAKISSHEPLTEYEIEHIIEYVKSKPKLKIFANTVAKIAKKYNSVNIAERVKLVTQFKSFLPNE